MNKGGPAQAASRFKGTAFATPLNLLEPDDRKKMSITSEVKVQKLALDSAALLLPVRLLFHRPTTTVSRPPSIQSHPPSTPRPTHCVGVDSSLPPMVPGVVQGGSGPSTSSFAGENNLCLHSQPLFPPPCPPPHPLSPLGHPSMARRREALGVLLSLFSPICWNFALEHLPFPTAARGPNAKCWLVLWFWDK